MTTQVRLTRGYVAIVDDEDADLTRHRWFAQQTDDHVCARRRYRVAGGFASETLHRVILGRILNRSLEPTEQVDHKDRNPLNNRRSNLRLATNRQQQANKVSTRNRLGLPGVVKDGNRYKATIKINYRGHHIGSFSTPEQAHEAYRKKHVELHGEFSPYYERETE